MSDKKTAHSKDADIALNLEKYKDYGENVRKEYEQLFEKMWTNLNESHLEPLVKVMRERENIVLKGQTQLIDSIRKHAQKSMVVALNNFWQAYGVSESLNSLEMCKDKFKDYEGHNWNINSKTPLERTRPIRMRFKESRARYLQAQLDFQQKELDETLKINAAMRQKFLDVKNQRIFLLRNMEQQKKNFSHAREEICRIHNEMLDQEENEMMKLLERANAGCDDEDENDADVNDKINGKEEEVVEDVKVKIETNESLRGEMDMDLDMSEC